ncbi:hypothetical protein EK21DRAFT_115051 [Setomelanomma holmii]|uniref:Uncharacterized protein n=1 Tax=Setomelanomma holmii TaxID=210430 RepID=A0A9P4H424_9PLEO|nr:hypothetical protein EK21DRAFT_115051 [Setomelanomma holmii]
MFINVYVDETMQQTIAYSAPPWKQMRVAHMYDGTDIWIDTLYTGSHPYIRLAERHIDPNSFIKELKVNGVKGYQWRTHAYGLWEKKFGTATWRREEHHDDREADKEEETWLVENDDDEELPRRQAAKRIHEARDDQDETSLKRPKPEDKIPEALQLSTADLTPFAPVPRRRSRLARAIWGVPRFQPPIRPSNSLAHNKRLGRVLWAPLLADRFVSADWDAIFDDR